MDEADKKRIFVSSTQADLREERKLVVSVVELLGLTPEHMERWGASQKPALDECLTRLERSAVMVLVVGFRYGSLCDHDDLSYTEAEYRFAKEKGKKIYAYLKDDGLASTKSDRDRDFQLADRLEKFRGTVNGDRRVTGTFASLDTFRQHISDNLADHYQLPRLDPLPTRSRWRARTIFFSENKDKPVKVVDEKRFEIVVPHTLTHTLAYSVARQQQKWNKDLAAAWMQACEDLTDALSGLFRLANEQWRVGEREYTRLLVAALQSGGLDRLASLPSKLKADYDSYPLVQNLAKLSRVASIARDVLSGEYAASQEERDTACRLVHKIVDWLFQGLKYAEQILLIHAS